MAWKWCVCWQLMLCTIPYAINVVHPSWINSKWMHRASHFNDAQIQRLCALNSRARIKQLLGPILVSRPVGSQNHRNVGDYLKKSLQDIGYHISEQIFTENTIIGSKTFRNIIATLNPTATRRLVLACHYDSKDFRPDFDFVGATDSAVPCALMLDIAHSLHNYTKLYLGNDPTLQLIFFDGEEAFKDWTDQDSLYGSRQLASQWQSQLYPAYYPTSFTELDRIDVLVLLDLMGAKDQQFFAHQRHTDYNVYRLLPEIEQTTRRLGNCLQKGRSMFYGGAIPAFIADDHVPFMERGVKVVHLIPLPFPDVWHTPRDDASAIDYNTVDNLATILRVFTASYLNIVP